MTLRSKIPLKLKNLVKRSTLTIFIYGRNFFPRSFVKFLLLHLFNAKLEVGEDKEEGRVSMSRYKGGAKGALCFSVDLDLPAKSSEGADVTSREAVAEILRLAENYKIPLSWGICGRFAIQEPAIFEQIIRSSVNHDLGVHTFSHMDLGSPVCSVEVAHADIMRCMEVLAKANRPVSFIFPWNREGHLPLLRKLGFVTYRGDGQTRITCPSQEEGLWNIRQTYFVNEKSVDGVGVILKLMDFAISYGGVLHVWSHPWNMHFDGDAGKFMERVMEPIFKHAAKRRDEGLLWVCTMRELANYSEARRNCQVEPFVEEQNGVKFIVNCDIGDPRFDFPPVVTLKIRLPSRSDALKVFVDEKETHQGEAWRIAGKWGVRHLFLTLSFENPVRRVRILTQRD